MNFVSVLPVLTLSLSVAAAPLVTTNAFKALSAGNYLITFKDEADDTNHFSRLSTLFDGDIDSGLRHRFNNSHFRGYSGKFSASMLSSLDDMSNDILSIEEDGKVYKSASSQFNATWGLQRISQRDALSSYVQDTALNFNYTYGSSGEGVDVYVVDTGIKIGHPEFDGRASYGYHDDSFTSAVDDEGHGSHVAGTIGGKTCGVSKNVNLIAVKVPDSEGEGTNSDLIAGIDYVISAAKASGRPSIASLSLGGTTNTALDSAVQQAINAGVHFVVAAGNENTDACNSSPARVSGATTVAASNINDARSSFSNYGSCDIYAPGENIVSVGIASDTATETMSGTSMATPHISGLLALILSAEGNMSPADATARLIELGTTDAITGVDGSSGTGSGNDSESGSGSGNGSGGGRGTWIPSWLLDSLLGGNGSGRGSQRRATSFVTNVLGYNDGGSV